MKLVNVNITVALSDTNLRSLQSITGSSDQYGGLASLATTTLTQLAEGGAMIDPLTARHIEQAVGRFDNPMDLIPLIEKGAGKDGSNTVIPLKLDPVNMPYWENLAEQQGVTVEAMFQNAIDHIIDQDWLYVIEPQPRKLRVTEDDYKQIAAVIGKPNPSGCDIAEFIKSLAANPLISTGEPYAVTGRTV